MISKTLEDIEKDIKYLKEIANEEYFKKVEKLCEKVNARSDKLQNRINKAIEYINTHSEMTDFQIYGIENTLAFKGSLEKLLNILGDNNE